MQVPFEHVCPGWQHMAPQNTTPGAQHWVLRGCTVVPLQHCWVVKSYTDVSQQANTSVSYGVVPQHAWPSARHVLPQHGSVGSAHATPPPQQLQPSDCPLFHAESPKWLTAAW